MDTQPKIEKDADSDRPSADKVIGSESDLPPIRHPVLFYICISLAFGFLGAAVLVLIL